METHACHGCNSVSFLFKQGNTVNVSDKFKSGFQFYQVWVSLSSRCLNLCSWDRSSQEPRSAVGVGSCPGSTPLYGPEQEEAVTQMYFTKSEGFFLVLSHCCPGFSGPPLDAGASTVDLEAARQALDQLFSISWIKNSVRLHI